jgi:hypothetical protein
MLVCPLLIVVLTGPILTPLHKLKSLKGSGKCRGKFVPRQEDVWGTYRSIEWKWSVGCPGSFNSGEGPPVTVGREAHRLQSWSGRCVGENQDFLVAQMRKLSIYRLSYTGSQYAVCKPMICQKRIRPFPSNLFSFDTLSVQATPL